MQDAVSVALLATLVLQFTNFLKYLVNRDWSATLTQLEAWGAGFVAVLIFAASSVASKLIVYGINFADASWVDQLLLGLLIGSAGSTIYDFRRAVDAHDSAATPPLLPKLKRRQVHR